MKRGDLTDADGIDGPFNQRMDLDPYRTSTRSPRRKIVSVGRDALGVTVDRLTCGHALYAWGARAGQYRRCPICPQRPPPPPPTDPATATDTKGGQ